MRTYRIIRKNGKFFIDKLYKFWFIRRWTFWSRVTEVQTEELCGYVHSTTVYREFNSAEEAKEYIKRISNNKNEEVIETITI